MLSLLLISDAGQLIISRDREMKDRDDIRDDRDDLDERRENGTNGIDHKSSYSLCIRSTKPETNSS